MQIIQVPRMICNVYLDSLFNYLSENVWFVIYLTSNKVTTEVIK